MGEEPETRATSRPKPELQAVVLADDVYTDVDTNKKVIAGTFNQLWSAKFPSFLGKCTKVYIVLTNCHGSQKLVIRYVDLRSQDVLMKSQELEVFPKDPLERHEVVMEVPPFPMPHEGQYAFEVYCNGDLLGGIRLLVSKLETPKE